MTLQERFGRLDPFSQAAVRANGRDEATLRRCIEWCEAYEADRQERLAKAIAGAAPLLYPTA